MKRLLLLLCLPLLACPSEESLRDPGEFVLHRLNRAEYNNTVRDLFGTDLRPADDFPADDFGFGYDNIAATLSLSPLHIELYERAADRLIDDALHSGVTYPLEVAAEAEDATATVGTAGYDFGAGFWNLSTEGTLTATLEVPVGGVWFAGARAFGHSAGGEAARMRVAIDGDVLGAWDVTDVAGDAQIYGAELVLTEGPHTLEVAFTNDFESAATGADRNLLVDRLVLQGPLNVESPPNTKRDRLIPCDPAELGRRTCAAHAIRTFTERAWRRPISEDELLGLLGIYDLVIVEDDFDLAVASAIKAAMLSPWFVFRVELDANANDPTPHPLTPFELAARLSYFIWSSTPDDQLLDAARNGALETDERASLNPPDADQRARPAAFELGISVTALTRSQRAQLGVDQGGVLVTEVRPGSASGIAGLMPGDVIVSVAQQPIGDVGDFRNVLQAARGSESVPLLIQRRGSSLFLALDVPG